MRQSQKYSLSYTDYSLLKGSLDKYLRPLFLTTSNRYVVHEELPKSTQLAYHLAKEHGSARVIDVSKLNIYPCEGNISGIQGNNCGVKEALLVDTEKNPSGHHRCWASINNSDDQLWEITKELFKSDCLILFSSVRWGQTNSIHQKLIERLSWIQNRATTLEEEPIPVIETIDAGLVIVGQNWNGSKVLETQLKVLQYYGFRTPPELSLDWQYTTDAGDESQESYLEAPRAFESYFDLTLKQPVIDNTQESLEIETAKE